MAKEVSKEDETQAMIRDVQQTILKNVITAGNMSTFVRCANDTEEAEIGTIRDYTQKVANRQNDPEVKKNLDTMASRLRDIYSKTVYCAHCGKLATLVEDKKRETPLTFTCDCDGAKKEIGEKDALLQERAVIEQKYAALQTGVINEKALPLFKDHYKDIMKQRYADFMEYDNCILNLEKIGDEESK